MSRIYAGGVKATAIANIKADIATYITFNDQGVKVLNTDGLVAYLKAQFLLIITNTEFIAPADATTATMAAERAPAVDIVQSLNAAIGPARWTHRPDWPTDTASIANGNMVAAVLNAMADCKRLSDAVTNFYYDLNGKLSSVLTDYYAEKNLDSLVPAGVVRKVSSRVVIYTYVSDWGEESAPSPASDLLTLDQNDTATYTATTPPGGRNIVSVRWYRSQSTNTGALVATFVAEQLVATSLIYTDSKKDEELLEPCPTIGWDAPPANLQGLVGGSNGAMAGFFDNTLCPCINNVPYAFRVDDRRTVEWPIVGLGVFDQTYVVLTRGKPYYIEGADSQSLSTRKIDTDQACVSRRSIVSGLGGVKYASPDGICLANGNGVQVLTNLHFTREAWQALNPSSIFAAESDGRYFFHYDNGVTAGCYSLDLATLKLTTIDLTGSAFHRDLVTDVLYVADGITIKAMFTAATRRTGRWRGKKAGGDKVENMAWARVDSDFEFPVTVRLLRDGTLTDTVVLNSRDPVRLKAIRAQEHEVEVESQARVTEVLIAGSTAELQQL